MNFVNRRGVGTKDYRHVYTAGDGRTRRAGAVAAGRREVKAVEGGTKGREEEARRGR